MVRRNDGAEAGHRWGSHTVAAALSWGVSLGRCVLQRTHTRRWALVLAAHKTGYVQVGVAHSHACVAVKVSKVLNLGGEV